MRTYQLRKKITSKDNEGGTVITFGEPVDLIGEVWPARSRLQVETYGDRINSIFNCKVKGEYAISVESKVTRYVFNGFSIKEGDGICLFSEDEPDYQIVAIKPYKPLYMEVEKR